MPVVSELSLPRLDHTDPALRGGAYRRAMRELSAGGGWLAASPFGVIVLDRESGEFFLRSRDTAFPGLTIAQLFGVSDGPLHEEIVCNIINRQGEDHRRLRHLVNPALAPRTVDRYRPAMRRFLGELVAGLPEEESFDFIERVAKPYPSLVIAEVMGAPLSDAPRLHHFSSWIQRQFDPASLIAERETIEQAVSDFYAYADALITARRSQPAEDLITDLIAAEEPEPPDAASVDPASAPGRNRARLDHGELRNLVLNILVGGVDTSQSQLAHAIRLLAEHPDQWQALRQDPSGLAAAAVEEALRYEPITPFTARITTSEIEHRGVTFPPGTVVLVSAWHANRDGILADGFDISRPPSSRLLTFGAGIHYCVGANLARAEMQEALAALAIELQTVELAGEPTYGTASGIYGLESLPLRVTRAPGAGLSRP